jgi:DNA-binding NarL/FixJ family response regulator
MKTIFISTNSDILDEWANRYSVESPIFCYDVDSLNNELEKLESSIIIADYDSVAPIINNFISSNSVPNNLIVLERVPEITTGKMLISHGIKAYGNSKMQAIHFGQMIEIVEANKVWAYPKLTKALAEHMKKNSLNDDSINLIKNKLTDKEAQVVYQILDGFANDAIADKMNISTRTVKAHISSIFQKLHVNNRLALVLLLK